MYTKNMCFTFKRERILQAKHLGWAEMEKLLAEVHSCIDFFHFLLWAPTFHIIFLLHQKTLTNPTSPSKKPETHTENKQTKNKPQSKTGAFQPSKEITGFYYYRNKQKPPQVSCFPSTAEHTIREHTTVLRILASILLQPILTKKASKPMLPF